MIKYDQMWTTDFHLQHTAHSPPRMSSDSGEMETSEVFTLPVSADTPDHRDVAVPSSTAPDSAPIIGVVADPQALRISTHPLFPLVRRTQEILSRGGACPTRPVLSYLQCHDSAIDSPRLLILSALSYGPRRAA